MKDRPADSPRESPEPGPAAARPPYIIDTSVAVKWYIPEPHSLAAKGYMSKGLDRHAPS
jgi:hypothetical protein